MATKYFGSSDGLTIVDGDMSAFLTSVYNTAWMQGTCELALCDGLTDRSGNTTVVTDNGVAVIAAAGTGTEQKKITATGGSITAPVTTGGAIYGWELVSSVWHFRNNTGWVGVSEAAGTLTVADATTFAMLRYTNGAGPSASQFTKQEEDEKHLFQENALATISADAVTALAVDPFTGLLEVGTAGDIDTISGITPIKRSTDDAGTFISIADGLRISQ